MEDKNITYSERCKIELEGLVECLFDVLPTIQRLRQIFLLSMDLQLQGSTAACEEANGLSQSRKPSPVNRRTARQTLEVKLHPFRDVFRRTHNQFLSLAIFILISLLIVLRYTCFGSFGPKYSTQSGSTGIAIRDPDSAYRSEFSKPFMQDVLGPKLDKSGEICGQDL